ncbi:MAG: secondary thiamine-phosphate synthase enzyme YjbQ [Clostridium sp.]|nr:secondary thiamine-phosphate synthase enzyme YjbQ [Clostridium sp.]
MTVYNEHFLINTHGFTDIIDITQKVKSAVYQHNIKNGNVVVALAGSTASITTIEYEPGLLKDLPDVLDEIAPVDKNYHHDDTWHDGNGYAHVRAAIFGSSISVPLIDGALLLGTWQQIVLIDFDNKPRARNVYVQIIT